MTWGKARSIAVGENEAALYEGDALKFLKATSDGSVDLVFSSPPYCIGKAYDRSFTPEAFLKEHKRVLKTLVQKVKPGGSICWQVGVHASDRGIVPLDALVFAAASVFPELQLRNRIVWTFAHGAHAARRFSGRYETVLWFTKGSNYIFNLDEVRVPQRYPGKRHYKGPRKGEWSGNPLGKNPGDVWDIPNVKARHPEKTEHPCQFPVALVRRFIRALTDRNSLVIDPYFGSGTTAVAALAEGRNFAGSEILPEYVTIAEQRLTQLRDGSLKMRPDVPVRTPVAGEAVAEMPPHFRIRPLEEIF